MNAMILTAVFGLTGDCNSDTTYNTVDQDALIQGIYQGLDATDIPQCDANLDGEIDVLDVFRLNELAGPTLGFVSGFLDGDANWDGHVNSADLNIVGSNWQHLNRRYTGGDFNADGITNVADMNMVGGNWLQSVPRAGAVPEPSGLLLMLCGLAVIRLRKDS